MRRIFGKKFLAARGRRHKRHLKLIFLRLDGRKGWRKGGSGGVPHPGEYGPDYSYRVLVCMRKTRKGGEPCGSLIEQVWRGSSFAEKRGFSLGKKAVADRRFDPGTTYIRPNEFRCTRARHVYWIGKHSPVMYEVESSKKVESRSILLGLLQWRGSRSEGAA